MAGEQTFRDELRAAYYSWRDQPGGCVPGRRSVRVGVVNNIAMGAAWEAAARFALERAARGCCEADADELRALAATLAAKEGTSG